MSSRVFAYGNGAHVYQVPFTQYPDTSLDMQAAHYSDAVDGHTDAESNHGAQNCSWSGSGSESGEYMYTLKNVQLTDERMTGDYRRPYSAEGVYYTKPGNSAVHSTYFPVASTSYTPYTPQFEMSSIASSSNIPLSFIHTTRNSPCYERSSLSYPRSEEETHMLYIETSQDDVIPNDGVEPYYDDNDSPGGAWMPEMSQNISFVQPDMFAGNFAAECASKSEKFGFLSKEMLYYHAQQPPDEEVLHQWSKGMHPQDPSAYYPSFPAGIRYSHPTHLSADTSNTPSDFTSSESPLSPLEYETCQSDVSSTISPDTHLAPLPAFVSSSMLPEQTLPPIIHAPRPTRTIDSSYFERLIAASEISNDD